MKSRFPIGSWVTVKSIKKSGVIESVSQTSVTVVVGNLRMRCKEQDLSAAAEPAPKRDAPLRVSASTRSRSGRAQARIDLHGLRVLEAVDRTAKALDRALLEGQDALEIIHGIGEGKVRDAVHRYLRDLSAVRHFAVDPLNPGVTKVYL